jgi:hypothetical protein
MDEAQAQIDAGLEAEETAADEKTTVEEDLGDDDFGQGDN